MLILNGGIAASADFAIEDETDQIILLQTHGETIGCDSISGKNREEGLRKAGEENPDLIHLGLRMPTMGGFEVCRRLRENSKTKERRA